MSELLTLEEQYQKMPKEALRINVELSSPIVIPQNPIHLDSLLAQMVALEHYSAYPDRWQNINEQIELPLPLEEYKGENYTIWKGSAAYIKPLHKEFTDFWVKKTYSEFSPFESTNIVWGKGVISNEVEKSRKASITLEKATGPYNDSARGGYKSNFDSRFVIETKELIFHAVGNRDEVKRLLNNLSFVGKKHAVGYGKVNKITVTKSETDYSILDPNGNPARTLPVADFPNLKMNMTASPVKPPYWSNKRVICINPIDTIPVWEWDAAEEIIDEIDEEEYWFDD